MRFEDVVQNGVLQAFGLATRTLSDRKTRPMTEERRKRLLEYKGERVSRNLIRWLNQGYEPQIIWD